MRILEDEQLCRGMSKKLKMREKVSRSRVCRECAYAVLLNSAFCIRPSRCNRSISEVLNTNSKPRARTKALECGGLAGA